MAKFWRQSLPEHLAEWRQLLSVNNFGWLWVGQVLSQIGDGVSKVALLFFVYDLTGSALKMTVIGILETIPPLVLGPFVGVSLDRIPKRAAMIVIDVTRAVLLTVIPLLYALGLLTLMRLYVLVFAVALFSMAFGPALNAAIPLLVKQNQLTRANAIMQSSTIIGQLLGPAISGVLIAVIGAPYALYITAGAFILSAAAKIPLRIPHRMSSRRRRAEPLARSSHRVSLCVRRQSVASWADARGITLYPRRHRLCLFVACNRQTVVACRLRGNRLVMVGTQHWCL